MLTGFGMHARLGFLVAVAMGVSCLAAIILLPAVLYLIRPQFVFGTPSLLSPSGREVNMTGTISG
jgi:hypothetical protein